MNYTLYIPKQIQFSIGANSGDIAIQRPTFNGGGVTLDSTVMYGTSTTDLKTPVQVVAVNYMYCTTVVTSRALSHCGNFHHP